MRIFFAVVTADRVKEVAAQAIDSFPVVHPPWRWIPPRNFHITLKFLGEVADGALPALREAAQRVASLHNPFDIAYGRFGGFPSLSRPRVIFYRLERGMEELASLAATLEEELASAGYPRERRPFRAHLTLARIKRPLPADVRDGLIQVPALAGNPSQRVDSFVLMRSILRREGAVYEEIERFGLAGEK